MGIFIACAQQLSNSLHDNTTSVHNNTKYSTLDDAFSLYQPQCKVSNIQCLV